MGGVLRLARPFGIAVDLHWTFVLLLAWVAWVHVAAGHGPRAAAEGLALVVLVFACVVLHELGHALAARRFGIGTRSITLYPFGGLARLDRLPTSPWQELVVALAGPAVNVGLAAGLAGVLAATGEPVPWPPAAGGPVAELLVVNAAMAAFNLLPAFPMDGGRVLRAALSLRLDRALATRIAASVGQVLAIAFGVAGVFVNPMLLFAAVFVYVGAEQEAQATALQGAVAGARVADAMQSRVRVLSADATLREAVEELLAGDQQDFPLVDERGAYVAMLRRDALLRAVLRDARVGRVVEAADREGPSAGPAEDLGAVVERMASSGLGSLPVVEGGRVRGLLTGENLAEWVALRGALAVPAA